MTALAPSKASPRVKAENGPYKTKSYLQLTLLLHPYKGGHSYVHTDCQTRALYAPSRIEPHRLPLCQPVLPDSQCENDSPRRNPKQKIQGTIEVVEALEP